MKERMFIYVIMSLFLISFVSAESCEVQIEDYESRLENLEQKIDTIESHYNLLPTIAQDIKQLEIEVEEVSSNDSNFKIYLVPGTIVISLIILMVIVLARRKNG